MRDLLTRITMNIGRSMAAKESNILNEDKVVKSPNWKYDVILTYVAANFSKRDLPAKCLELAKEFELDAEYQKPDYWKNLIKDLKDGTKKEQQKEVEKEVKKITHYAPSYGCGSSDYGCGGSSRRSSSYGCGSSYHSYGCGGSSSSYGC